MNQSLADFMQLVERAGAFEPRLVINILREDDGDHMLADMIEGMADRIDELERKVAVLDRSKGARVKRKR